MLIHYYYCHYHFCTCVVLGSFPPLCLPAVSLNLSSITYVNISIRSHGKDCKIYIKDMHCWFLPSLCGRIKSFTVSVFPIRKFFFMLCWIYCEYQIRRALSNQPQSLALVFPQIQSARRQTRRVMYD